MKHEHVEHVNWLVEDTVGEWFGVGLEGDALRSWRVRFQYKTGGSWWEQRGKTVLGTNVCACCADMRGVTGRLPSRKKRAHAARLTAPSLCRFRRFRRFRGHARRDEVLKWVERRKRKSVEFFFFFLNRCTLRIWGDVAGYRCRA